MSKQLTLNKRKPSLSSTLLVNARVNPYLFPGLLKEIEPDIPRPDKFPLTNLEKLELIKELFERHYGFTYAQLNAKTQKQKIVRPRQHFIWILNKYTSFSLREIGEIFNRGAMTYKTKLHPKGLIKPMDHSTVLHAIETWDNIRATNVDSRINSDKLVLELETLIQKYK